MSKKSEMVRMDALLRAEIARFKLAYERAHKVTITFTEAQRRYVEQARRGNIKLPSLTFNLYK